MRPSVSPTGDQGRDQPGGSEEVSYAVGSHPWPPCFQSLTNYLNPPFCSNCSNFRHAGLRSWNEIVAQKFYAGPCFSGPAFFFLSGPSPDRARWPEIEDWLVEPAV